MQSNFCIFIGIFQVHRLFQHGITAKSVEGVKKGHTDIGTEKSGSGEVSTGTVFVMYRPSCRKGYGGRKAWWEDSVVPGCKDPGRERGSCSSDTLVDCTHLQSQENFGIPLTLTHMEHGFANFRGVQCVEVLGMVMPVSKTHIHLRFHYSGFPLLTVDCKYSETQY